MTSVKYVNDPFISMYELPHGFKTELKWILLIKLQTCDASWFIIPMSKLGVLKIIFK